MFIALEEDVREALKSAQDPFLERDLISANCLKNIVISIDKVEVSLRFGYPLGNFETIIKSQIQALLAPLLGSKSLAINISWKINYHAPQKGLKSLPNIKNIIAVASGKGGVGKSTTAINLAIALQGLGAHVGILDADIYGPSMPLLLGINERPIVREDKRMEPIRQYGLQSMSMGYLVQNDTPMVWRGPMVSSALQQLLNETAWDNLDYLIVDLPPGTGDIQLTMAQKIPVSGALIVTTPQDIALIDAQKALMMFKKLDISVLGVVENMSGHICSSCGNLDFVFGHEGGKKMAENFGLTLLGQLPLDRTIRELSDLGQPHEIVKPNSNIAILYRDIARKVSAQLSLQPKEYNAITPSLVD